MLLERMNLCKVLSQEYTAVGQDAGVKLVTAKPSL